MNHLIILFKPSNVHSSKCKLPTEQCINRTSIYINCSSQTSRVSGNVFDPTTCCRVQGESGQHAGMTLQATPGHIWTREGSSALTPAHLELTHSEEAKRCINNTCTNVQYVLQGKYLYTGRHALLHHKNKHASSYMCHVCLCVFTHTCRKRNCMLNHDIL